jgi:hypothetical protein
MEKRDVATRLNGLPASFATHLHQYQRWRDELINSISDYQNWVEQQQLADGEQDLRVYELVEGLKSDKITIAVVAEFSRGKSELLNAIFFADHKDRLIPAAAGRTTMCPTELRYDEKDGPSVKLLPIDTRKTSLTISEYKQTPIHWTTFHILKPHSSEELRELFSEVTKTKKVHVREAHELGLYDSNHPDASLSAPSDGLVEVPVWRHAIINYPHPLLKQGLVILDTPGLNALGSEPELTLSMLPNAHAVAFVLAADAGVTKTDLEVWMNHVNPLRSPKVNGHLVVLNKIDMLWDELHNSDSIMTTLARQLEDSSQKLGIDRRSLFPVSAQKGFAAKKKGDYQLLQRSGLPALEAKLAEDILPSKHEIIRNRVIYEISGRVESSRLLLQSKLSGIDRQLAELKHLGGKNLDTIQKVVSKIREEKNKYDKEVDGFKLTHKVLSEQAKILLGFLSLRSFDRLIKKTRRDMHESWTTYGLKTGMETFFRGAMLRMENALKQSNEIISIVNNIYERLHQEYRLPRMTPANLKLIRFIIALKELEQKAEAFRNSPVTMMTEQHFVVKKFFISLASEARTVFLDCNAYAKNWFQACMSLVSTQIKDHRNMINRNLANLNKIHKNMDTLGDSIADLETAKHDLEGQIETIDKLLARIHQPFD